MVQDTSEAGASVVMTTNGDMVYYNSGRQRLPKGSDGNVLTQASGLPSWASAGGGATTNIDNVVLGSLFETSNTSLTLVTGFSVTTQSSGSFSCAYNGSSNGASASDTIYFAIKFDGTIVNQIWCYSDIAGTWNVNPAMTYFGASDGNDIEGFIQSMSGSAVRLIGGGATGVSSSFRVLNIA